MANSFTFTYDVTIRSLIYTRFGSILGINTLAPLQVDAINKGVILCPKGIAQRLVAEKRGQTFLEFINVYPNKFEFSWKRQRTSVARRGLRYTKLDNTVGIIKADAVDIEYSMWFWSISLDKVRECMEKYIQWQHDNPKITLLFNDEFEMNPDIRFSSVADESHIEDIFNTGKIWVYRMTAAIEGWLPKTPSSVNEIHKIHLTTYDKDDVTSYTTIAVEDSNQDVELANALRMLQANLYGIKTVDYLAKTFTVLEDRTAEFTSDKQIIVENSTDNNGAYVVDSSSYSELTNKTTIIVQESPVSNIADGNIYFHEGVN